MSIIYDALKKVEASRGKQSESKAGTKPFYKASPHLIFLFMLSLGLFIAYRTNLKLDIKSLKNNLISAWDGIQVKTGMKKPQALHFVSPPPKPKPAVPTPEPVVQKKGGFILNGIYCSENECYALINNQIARPNDEVGGAVVKRISQDYVELEYGGKSVLLSTSSN